MKNCDNIEALKNGLGHLVTFHFVVILDSDGVSCQTANFLIGYTTTSTRSWNIRITQYDCTQRDESGPPGCLQYYTQTTNSIQKYVLTNNHRIFKIKRFQFLRN